MAQWTQRQPPSESGGLSAYLLEDHGFRKMFFKKLMGCFFHFCWFCALESCVLSVLFRASRSRKIEIEIIKWIGLKSFMMFGAFSQVPRICISLCKVFLAFLSYKGGQLKHIDAKISTKVKHNIGSHVNLWNRKKGSPDFGLSGSSSGTCVGVATLANRRPWKPKNHLTTRLRLKTGLQALERGVTGFAKASWQRLNLHNWEFTEQKKSHLSCFLPDVFDQIQAFQVR